MQVEISLVIATYNSPSLIERNISTALDYLDKNFKTYELILIDDGSDKEKSFDESMLPKNVIFLRNAKNFGKGYSIRRGMLAAKGTVRVFTDIDLPYDLSFIKKSFDIILTGYVDAVIGDRSHPLSNQNVRISLKRYATSKILSHLCRLLVAGGVNDTQCGFKTFSGEAVDSIFPYLTINGFGFDVEIIYLLHKLGVPFLKLPVMFLNNDESSVSLFYDSLLTAMEIVGIPFKWKSGVYDSISLNSLRSRS